MKTVFPTVQREQFSARLLGNISRTPTYKQFFVRARWPCISHLVVRASSSEKLLFISKLLENISRGRDLLLRVILKFRSQIKTKLSTWIMSFQLLNTKRPDLAITTQFPSHISWPCKKFIAHHKQERCNNTIPSLSFTSYKQMKFREQKFIYVLG